MYLIDTTLSVNWYLLTGDTPPLLAELDIRIVPPKSNAIYIPSAITEFNYIPSTATTKGLVTYEFTPDKLGLWTIGLSTGDSSNNVDFYTHDILVSINDTLTKKFVKSDLL